MLTWLPVATSSRTQSPQTYSTVCLPFLVSSEPLHCSAFHSPLLCLLPDCWCLRSADFTPAFLSLSFSFYYSYSRDFLCLFSLSVGSHYQIGLSRSIQPNPCWQFYELFGESLCLISKTLLLCLPLCSDQSGKRFSESPELVALQTFIDTIFALRALGFFPIWETPCILEIL